MTYLSKKFEDERKIFGYINCAHCYFKFMIIITLQSSSLWELYIDIYIVNLIYLIMKMKAI